MKIKILKDYAAGKAGEIIDASFPAGNEQEYIDNGFIEIIKEEPKLTIARIIEELKKAIELGPLEQEGIIDNIVSKSNSNKSAIKNQLAIMKRDKKNKEKEKAAEKNEVKKVKPKPDYTGFNDFIKEFTSCEDSELLERLEEGKDKFNLSLTNARKILATIKRKEREQRRAENPDDAAKKEMLLEEIEELWGSCPDELFQEVCEIDWRKGKYYFVKRLLKENTYTVDGVSVCGIKTFKDNKDIIKYSEADGIYIQDADIWFSKEAEKRLKDKATEMQVREVLGSIRRNTFYDRENILDIPKSVRPVGNGLWDIENKKLIPFTPIYVFLNKINININSEAKCERFEKFIKEVLDTKEERLAIQEWIGYCLLNDVRFSKALLLFGDGENGKSVLLNVIKSFLGAENVTSISLQYLESNPFSPSRLFGKSANIFADLPKKSLGQTSVFKMSVAGDAISGEKKGKDSFEFSPYAKMMFSCNEVPKTPDRTRGFFRRWVILKFNQHFPEGDPRRDETLSQKLTEEMEGILQYALEGLYRLLFNKSFTSVMSMLEIENFWMKNGSSVSAFVTDKIKVSTKGEIFKDEVYDKYEEYCTAEQLPAEEINFFWKQFHEFLEYKEVQISDLTGKRTRKLRGIKFI